MNGFNGLRLNPNEHRVAMLLADGLTTNSIAHLTGRSPAAIGRTRISIRRKLEVPAGARLPAYLREQPPAEPTRSDRQSRHRAHVDPDDRRTQLVLRTTIAELARLAGRANRRAVDLSQVVDNPSARTESDQLRALAQQVQALHDTFVRSIRGQAPFPHIHLATSPRPARIDDENTVGTQTLAPRTQSRTA